MAEIKRTTDRNRAIQAMMTDGEQLKTFYRFVANNPHIPLHDACQIVIERPSASVCFSFEEWNAQGRRVTKGRKGIPYYDGDGNKYFVFDVTDTHGENRYRRAAQPVKKILDGLDLLNGTEIADSNRGDYRIMLSGVVTYLGQNDFLTENDEIRNRLIAEGVAYSLYSTTGFPKERGITLKGYPYGLQDNADLFREVQKAVEVLQQDINDAIYNKQNEVPVIDDIDEEYVSDEPVIPKADEQPATSEEKLTVLPFYAEYLRVQNSNPDSIVVYRLGDFYEIMGEKAKQAATILDLTLTGRNVGLPERVPMCGFPYHVADTYLEKLIERTSVIVVEPDAEPFKILSRAEAKVEHALVEATEEEREEFERAFAEKESDEQSEPETEDDEPTDEEIEEAFAAAEAEENDGESDYDSEDYDYEESRKLAKTEKPENKGKRMFERRNRPSMQKSLFDAFETKTPEQELTEQILKGGSGVSGGKVRIYTEYLKNPYEKDFVHFLSKEYGVGGRGGPDGIDEMHDGKGIRFSKKNTETGEAEVAVNLKWEQAAVKIADLIDEENYLNDEEREEYDTLVRFREERSSAKSDDDLIKIIARQIVEYGTSHTYGEKYSAYPHFLGEAMQFYTQHYEEVNAELIKFDEVKSVGKGNIYPYSSPNILFKLPYCPLWQAKEARLRERDERIKEYADKFTRKCADEYRPTYGKNVVLTVTPEDISSREYLFLKDNREDFIKYFLKQKGVQDVNLSMQKIEITFDRRYIESLIAGKEQTPEERGKIRKIANGIIADGIKPNGLMAVITSKGTMDKQNPSIRKYLADRAELIGAVRLPNTAFKQTANTEVVTDILFFRKREEKINAAIENTEWLATGKTADGYEINNYYISHPEMILGTLVKETGLYGAEDITVKPDGRDLSEAINSAIGRLPQDFYVNPEHAEETESREEVEVDYDVKPMNLTAVNGKIYMRVGDSMVEQPVPPFPKDAYQRIAEMIEIRKQLRKVLDLQVEGCSDEVLLKEQRQLGTKYDGFVKRFGYINSKNNLRLFKSDGDSALLFACENVSDDEETVTKADVFTKRTIRPYTAVTSTDDCFEALQISKNERGSVDISYIEELTKKDYDTVIKELGNAVFRNPAAVNSEDKYSGFETAEEYLSGRVTDKLQTAERMKQSSPNLIDYGRLGFGDYSAIEFCKNQYLARTADSKDTRRN